jgi:hypothetical protein
MTVDGLRRLLSRALTIAGVLFFAFPHRAAAALRALSLRRWESPAGWHKQGQAAVANHFPGEWHVYGQESRRR